MMVKTRKLDTSRATKRCTLSIEIVDMKRLKARIWLGKYLIRFACLVIGCEVEISDRWAGQ